MSSDNKRLAKNTVFLYFRMFITMFVSLYTSRVVLKVLGVEDYGIYQTVGGIVVFLSFINSALSSGSSRFLTFELGKGNFDRLKRTFSTTFTVHIIIAICIVLVAESIGLWFLNHKLVIPTERLDAAIFVFHISIITAAFTITQVPYNASIIAHEKMDVFAYVSIIEVSLKLLVVYLLEVGSYDKLMFYSLLLLVVQTSIMLFYRIYCVTKFKETKYTFTFDSKIFKEIASFSSWSLFANGAIALNKQGILLLLNLFFAPSVVAARAISVQVNMAASQFVTNFRTAVNPQIVKLYASGKYKESEQLVLSSAKYSFFLMWIIAFPVCLLAQPLLQLWLLEVPKYTTVFLQIAIIQSLFQVFDFSFYTALYAKGRIKENALLSPLLVFLMFPITYVLFRFDFSPVALSWVSLITYVVIGCIIKPILVVKIVGYNYKSILVMFMACFKVIILSSLPTLLVWYYIDFCSLIGFIITGFFSLVVNLIVIYFFGLDVDIRSKLKLKINSFYQKYFR